MEVWKIIFLSKWVICRFHVNLPGCKTSWWMNLVFQDSESWYHLLLGCTLQMANYSSWWLVEPTHHEKDAPPFFWRENKKDLSYPPPRKGRGRLPSILFLPGTFVSAFGWYNLRLDESLAYIPKLNTYSIKESWMYGFCHKILYHLDAPRNSGKLWVHPNCVKPGILWWCRQDFFPSKKCLCSSPSSGAPKIGSGRAPATEIPSSNLRFSIGRD